MKRKISEERKQQLREQLEKARLKKKPAEYKNIHQSVLDLPDDAQYSFKNVREWIKDNKEQISALNKSSRSFRTDPKDKQKASNSSNKTFCVFCFLDNGTSFHSNFGSPMLTVIMSCSLVQIKSPEILSIFMKERLSLFIK